ncbi:hypothetical protein BSL78_17394 [Apostichopus japonicus]|uniref:Uncharacterized protein n=1 Tax=Stichopus japonicus TaxID=307972 RepID=A0A2G8KCL6_STIJA|nr:hypothetical protein BSL78_17394 [Apostichopus japonicus]
MAAGAIDKFSPKCSNRRPAKKKRDRTAMSKFIVLTEHNCNVTPSILGLYCAFYVTRHAGYKTSRPNGTTEPPILKNETQVKRANKTYARRPAETKRPTPHSNIQKTQKDDQHGSKRKTPPQHTTVQKRQPQINGENRLQSEGECRLHRLQDCLPTGKFPPKNHITSIPPNMFFTIEQTKIMRETATEQTGGSTPYKIKPCPTDHERSPVTRSVQVWNHSHKLLQRTMPKNMSSTL